MHRTLIALALLSLVLPASPAGAREESKIQIRLVSEEEPGPGNGVGRGGVRGDVHTQLRDGKIALQLRVRGLAPGAGYALLGFEDEDALEGVELLSFETASNGSANLGWDLATPDPRGKFLVLVDGDGDPVLSGWLYGAAEDDGRHTKVKEVTQLAPDDESDPAGQVEASYRTLPNGKSRLRVSTRGIPEGDYLLFIDGVEVAAFSPNPGGNAQLDFRTKTNPGQGPEQAKPHHKKMQLTLDPRSKLIEVERADGTPMFAGPMLAQTEN